MLNWVNQSLSRCCDGGRDTLVNELSVTSLYSFCPMCGPWTVFLLVDHQWSLVNHHSSITNRRGLSSQQH